MISPGDTIRDIRIVELLGEGGMGDVFLAVQEKIGREVAVKAIRADRRLDASAKVRFLREANILAQLEHPNICRLYDFIESEEEDLIVLELVRGRSLSEVIRSGVDDAGKMHIAEQILAALEAAHAISVIHRDLKPENIKVTEDGTVKVLDFGLARHVSVPSGSEMSGEQTAVTVPAPSIRTPEPGTLTHLGDVIGTPRYLSPEQARGEPLTAASDIYSFGLVLQELWTGKHPFAPGLSAEELVAKAMYGDVEPVVGIDRDIASLVRELVALAPRRRPSAAAARERLRWIHERPRRLAKRRLLAVVIVALSLAAAASTAGFFHARRSQRIAEGARAEAEAVNTFLRTMLSSPAPTERGIDTKVVDVLDGSALTVDVDLADHPLTRATVHLTLADTYFALGEWSAAREQYSKSAEIRREALGGDDPGTLLAEIGVGISTTNSGLYQEGLAALQASYERCRSVLGDNDETTIKALSNLSIALQSVNRYDEAESLIRRELEFKRSRYGERHQQTLRVRLNFANFLTRTGRQSEAASEYREVLTIATEALGPDHPDALAAEHNLACELTKDERLAEEALPLFADVIERRRRVLGEEHPYTVNSMVQEAVLLRRLGRFDAAEKRAREALEIRRRTLGDRHPETIDSTSGLAIILTKQGRHEEAEALYRQALADAESTLGPDHRTTLFIVGNLANLLTAEERWPEAEAAHRRLHAGLLALHGPDHERTWSAVNNLCGTLIAQGKTEEAEALVVDVLERATASLGPEHTRTLNAMGNYALILQRQGRLDEAEALLRKVIEITERNAGPDHPRALRARSDLASVLEDDGRPEEADAVRNHD